MARRIIKGDIVKVISGDHKGKITQVTQVLTDKNQVLLDGIGMRTRHVAKSHYNPVGGKRDVQVPINMSKVALVVDEKAGKTSRVGYKVIDGKKTRVARQAKNAVIKPTVLKSKATTKIKKKGAK